MRVSVLGSGSEGNAIYVEHDGTAILIDAGYSTAELDRRLVTIGVVGHSHIKALFLTHDHEDHARYAEQIQKKWHVPVLRDGYGRDGHGSTIPGFTVYHFPVPHDALDAYGYIVLTGPWQGLAVCLDAGCITPEINGALHGWELIILGCDYDDELLDKNSSYPAELKNRIRSNTGHLSNAQVAAWLRDGWDGKAHTIILAHLSQSNNMPIRATLAAFGGMQERTDGAEKRTRLIVSTQDEPTPLVEV